jgi:hypothetical protein
MPAGERKMPEPMVLPTRIATALQSPMRRGSAAEVADVAAPTPLVPAGVLVVDAIDDSVMDAVVGAVPAGDAGASDAVDCGAGGELGIHYATARDERWRVV